MEMKKYRLDEICKIERGSSPRPIQEFITENADGVNWIKIGDISSTDKYVLHTAEKITKEGAKKSRKVEIGDFILSNSMSLGRPYIMGIEGYIHDGWFVLRLDFNTVDQEYLYYSLISSSVQAQFHGTSTGSVVKNIRSELVKEITINLPSLENQKQTVKVLSEIDSKIALNNRINAKLEQMAKRLYDYWFVQFDFPGADGKPYKSNGGKMVWNEELKREIPEGWEVKKLGDLFTTNRGVSYSTATITGDGGIPMINLASFSPDGTYKVSGLKLFTGEYTKEKVLKPYDLVLCNTQQTAIDFTKDIIGKVLLVPDIFEGDITSSHHVNTLHVNNEDLKFYLYRLCNTDYFHKYISNYASGTNVLGLDFSGVENFKAEIPPAELLAKFAKLMLNIEKKKSEVIKENQKLIAMRDKLLPLLMNGQVVVE